MEQLRKIIHIDMDAFYASVELLSRPELRHVPMIVASERERAVVTTANYAARQFGLRSAMSVARAKQLCPQVVCIAPNFTKYRAVSLQLQHIYQRYTDFVEPISLDEAYLDVTDQVYLPSATAVAEAIRADIVQETGLTASAGVAPNKFLAKIASDWHKPNGLCVIKPSQVQRFIYDLALEKVPGVGKVTLQKMHHLGWHKIADIQSLTEHELIYHFGKFGQRLFLYAQGQDHREVEYQRERQQISKEITFSIDYHLAELQQVWHDLTCQVWQQMQTKQLLARGVQIKLKTSHFKTLQHSRSFTRHFSSFEQLYHAVQQLLTHFQTAEVMRYRLAGVGVFHLSEQDSSAQLSFLEY